MPNKNNKVLIYQPISPKIGQRVSKRLDFSGVLSVTMDSLGLTKTYRKSEFCDKTSSPLVCRDAAGHCSAPLYVV